jgi:hypothetical protein
VKWGCLLASFVKNKNRLFHVIQPSIFSTGEISPKCETTKIKIQKFRDFGGFQSLKVGGEKKLKSLDVYTWISVCS